MIEFSSYRTRLICEMKKALGGGSVRLASGIGASTNSSLAWCIDRESLEMGRQTGRPKASSMCDGVKAVPGLETEHMHVKSD